MERIDRFYDVLIVGGGPAGLTAGLYARRAALKVLLIEKGLLGGQIAISKDVENYPGIEGITGLDLAERLVSHVRNVGLDIDQQEVVEVIPGDGCHAVRLAGGAIVRAKALILAMGVTQRKLGVPGEAEYLGRGVSYCATCDGPFFRGRTVIVVGGGDTAVEESVYLARIAKRVFLVHRGGEFRAARVLLERALAEPRIEFVRHTIVTEVRGDGETVRSVLLEGVESGEQRELAADGIFILIGSIPNNKLIPPEIPLSAEGSVLTDERGGTAVPGIFVAGDLRTKYANQIVIAAADGAIAGLAASRYIESQEGRMLQAAREDTEQSLDACGLS